MTLASDEFIRRFLIHVLSGGFHRIRHYGLFASSKRGENIARARQLLAVPKPQSDTADAVDSKPPSPRRFGNHAISPTSPERTMACPSPRGTSPSHVVTLHALA
jgi:hypothetical protein